MSKLFSITQVAESIPFDNSSNGFIADEVQSAIEEIGASASPGFSWGRSGNSNVGTYLQVDSVPSNLAGRIVPLSSGIISDIFMTCEKITTCSVEIQVRVGATFTTIHTETLTASRKKTSSLTGVTVSLGDELCCRISSGSAKNIVVGVIIKGNT